MAEAFALLGVTAASLQCAHIGVKLLILGASLRSKLQDAPDRVQGWLTQIEQLVQLTDLLRQLDLSTLSPVQPQPSNSSATALPAASSIAWMESALIDCTRHAESLQVILKSMVHEVDSTRRTKLWKSILTVKREAAITSALEEIERHKSMLNAWLSQQNLHRLGDLSQVVTIVGNEVKHVNQSVLDVEEVVRGKSQTVLDAVNTNASVLTTELAISREEGRTSGALLGQQLQCYHDENKSQVKAMHMELRAISRELKDMKAVKHEMRKLAAHQIRMARTPSLLKETLDREPERAQVSVSNPQLKRQSRSLTIAPRSCLCGLRTWNMSSSSNATLQISLRSQDSNRYDCPVHRSIWSRFAGVRLQLQKSILANVVRLAFEAKYGAGGFSFAATVKAFNRIAHHPLNPFFYKLYHPTRQDKSSKNEPRRAALIRLAQKQLDHAFRSGLASPNDVDIDGHTLIHLQIVYGRSSADCLFIGEPIIKFLLSMGARRDIVDEEFIRNLLFDVPDDKMTPLRLIKDGFLDSPIMNFSGPLRLSNAFKFMTHWPETVEDFAYPYICDILLRKSTRDLEKFVKNGFMPQENSCRLLSPLHLAAAANWPEGLSLLLASGLDKFSQDSNGLLPIDHALISGCSEAALILMEGDCSPYFRESDILSHRYLLFSRSTPSVQAALLRTLHSGDVLNRDTLVFHDLFGYISWERNPRNFLETLFTAGFADLELRDKEGKTALMVACEQSDFFAIEFLLDKACNPLSIVERTGVVAGHFLSGSTINLWDAKIGRPHLIAKLLKGAFDVAESVKSQCRCSPNGFTPVTATMRATHYEINIGRRYFQQVVSLMHWPQPILERYAREYVHAEVFKRLEMTHTCCKTWDPTWSMEHEDQIEIENEEEELYQQLQDFMTLYDEGLAYFAGEALEYLDIFLFEFQLSVPPSSEIDNFGNHKFNSWQDQDLLGPGGGLYQWQIYKFSGEEMYHGHKERVTEENILALLFGKDHLLI